MAEELRSSEIQLYSVVNGKLMRATSTARISSDARVLWMAGAARAKLIVKEIKSRKPVNE